MKPLIQKLPLDADISFIAKTFRTPHFEVPWHQHIEYELILFTEGNGMCFIGNYVGEFKKGDIFFIGSNVPHTFQKQEKDLVCSALVVQFTSVFWGAGFLDIPENNEIKSLFDLSMKGLKMQGSGRKLLNGILPRLEKAKGFERLVTLLNCLQIIIKEEDKLMLASRQMNLVNNKYKERIDSIFQFTITHFQDPISLTEIADIANMSVTAFCAYFKKSTKKSYVEFLNEIRIGYACTLLQDTDKPVIEICYESGFNTAVNFNKQFLKIKGVTPSQFRQQFSKYVEQT